MNFLYRRKEHRKLLIDNRGFRICDGDIEKMREGLRESMVPKFVKIGWYIYKLN